MQHYTVYFIWKLLYIFRMVTSPIMMSANNCIYCIWYLSQRYSLLPLSWKRHPQHTQTGSNTSTIEADSSNGVTNTRCCRYSCMRSWWWMVIPPETAEQFPDKINYVTLHLVGYIYIFFAVALRPNAGHDLILEVFISHTTTHHSQ
jgi:hypothetical protein